MCIRDRAMSEIKKVKYDDLGAMLEGLKRSFELLLIPIGEALIPLLNVLAETIAPIIEVISDSLSPILAQLSEVIPVSYTHLDVYQRQPLCRSMDAN